MVLFLFSLAGCNKRIPYIKPDKIVSVIEKDLDLEEVEEYDEEGYVAHDHGKLGYTVSAFTENKEGLLQLDYKIWMSSEQADESFSKSYKTFTENAEEDAEVGGYISKDDHGYVTYETDGVFIALYCTKDMTLWVKAHSDDSIDDAKEFLKDLGIPTE